VIQLRDVSIEQGAFRLAGVSLEVPTGQYGVLMGKTGCGKTSLLEAVAGLRPIRGGGVTLGGRDVTDLAPGERGIGYVPQDAALFYTMTVRQHLAFALTVRDWTGRAIQERVTELANWLEIAHLLDRRPAGLSGGEAQRVALGRALSFHPKVVLLDEPLSSLDERTRTSMIALLAGLRKGGDVTVLHVTHNTGEAEQLADVRYRLEGGRVIRE
jgi:molybdate/tungstate transport system ATP-binding protein